MSVNEHVSQPPISMEDYRPGTSLPDNYSLPIEYNVEGEIMFDSFQVGKSLILARYKRNGVFAGGKFATTEIKEIGKSYFKTENSLYYYRIL